MRPSSRVNHAMLIITRFACTSMIWKPNSNACHGASNLYGLLNICQWEHLNSKRTSCVVIRTLDPYLAQRC